MLAFSFYIACNPDKTKDNSKPREDTVESRPVTADSLTAFEGKVIGIKDGDTFEVLRDGKPEKIRLSDIDSPESVQPFGKAAKKYASDLCFGKMVKVEPKKKRDRYGRILGTVYIDDSVNINAKMIAAGYAWRYKYSKNKEYKGYESKARNSHSGLWADDNPVDPWQWRKDKRTKNNINNQ